MKSKIAEPFFIKRCEFTHSLCWFSFLFSMLIKFRIFLAEIQRNRWKSIKQICQNSFWAITSGDVTVLKMIPNQLKWLAKEYTYNYVHLINIFIIIFVLFGFLSNIGLKFRLILVASNQLYHTRFLHQFLLERFQYNIYIFSIVSNNHLIALREDSCKINFSFTIIFYSWFVV